MERERDSEEWQMKSKWRVITSKTKQAFWSENCLQWKVEGGKYKIKREKGK